MDWSNQGKCRITALRGGADRSCFPGISGLLGPPGRAHACESFGCSGGISARRRLCAPPPARLEIRQLRCATRAQSSDTWPHAARLRHSDPRQEHSSSALTDRPVCGAPKPGAPAPRPCPLFSLFPAALIAMPLFMYRGGPPCQGKGTQGRGPRTNSFNASLSVSTVHRSRYFYSPLLFPLPVMS